MEIITGDLSIYTMVYPNVIVCSSMDNSIVLKGLSIKNELLVHTRGVASLKFKVRICGTGRTYTNSVDPDETPQNAASHQGLLCFPIGNGRL